MKELNKRVFELAKQHQACLPKLMEISGLSVDQLLKLYVENLDYSLCAEFLTADFLKQNASKDQLQGYGIFIDELNVIRVDEEKTVYLGDCHGMFLAGDYSVSQLFLKDSSHIDLDAVDHSFTVVDLFNNSHLNIVAKDEAKVYVSVYGNARVEFTKHGNAQVKIVHTQLEKYKDAEIKHISR